MVIELKDNDGNVVKRFYEDEDDERKSFVEWYESMERTFHTCQFHDDEIAFSAWVAGMNYQKFREERE